MGKINSIAVYLGATMPRNPAYTDAVRELGTEIASRGITLVFGGSREGTMTVLADAVLGKGGKAIGVFTRNLPMSLLYPGLTETIITDDLAERKAGMFARADAVIGMPGSFGTWDELFDVLERSKMEMINRRKPKPIGILNLNGFYDGLAELVQHSIDEGFTSQKYRNLLRFADNVPALLDIICKE
ncbi:MAG: TIGR00730 family Rossman fold protein [Victivallales bacterium]|nr:TIGR00730 family Rossman fold protein [Victivallales bacterium]